MGELTSGYWNQINWTPEMCAHIRQRREERWSCIRIGEEMGISDRSIKNQLVRMGMPTTLPPLVTTTHKEACERHVARPERTDPWAGLRRALHVPIPPAKDCQYPHGDERPFRFCGAPIWRGSYCRECYARCHSEVWTG